MKYFSMFSGIGGFELGIGDRGECVGYSEIDKYAISVYTRKCCKCANCVYNRSICESVLNVKNQKEKQNSTLALTPEDANFVSEKNSELNIETTLKNTEVLLKDGKTEILKSIKQSIEKSLGSEGKNFLICMEENVPVVENQKKSSLPLSIKIKTDIKIEKNTEQDILTNLPLKEKTQINMKSSAITATTQEQDMADVLTKTYEKRPCLLNLGDCTKIIASELPDFQPLVGGFPCQSFSIAGKRGGFQDTRGTLFFEIARIVKDKRPAYLLLENVKGLLNHDKGNTFATIISTLDELGYDCQWCVLNSKNFGVPQNRERVFIVGHLRGTSRPKVFPIGEVGGETNQAEKLREQVSNTLRTNYSNGKSNETYIGELKEITKNQSQGGRVYDPQGIASTLAGEAGGVGAKTGLYAIPTNTKLGYDLAEEKKDGIRLQFPKSKSARGRVVKGSAQALQASGAGGVLDNMKIRRLTPTECERLQGFPDGWTEGISDTQRYKCLGNAVTVNVIKEIIKSLIS